MIRRRGETVFWDVSTACVGKPIHFDFVNIATMYRPTNVTFCFKFNHGGRNNAIGRKKHNRVAQ